jgi:hypothetical protein
MHISFVANWLSGVWWSGSSVFCITGHPQRVACVVLEMGPVFSNVLWSQLWAWYIIGCSWESGLVYCWCLWEPKVVGLTYCWCSWEPEVMGLIYCWWSLRLWAWYIIVGVHGSPRGCGPDILLMCSWKPEVVGWCNCWCVYGSLRLIYCLCSREPEVIGLIYCWCVHGSLRLWAWYNIVGVHGSPRLWAWYNYCWCVHGSQRLWADILLVCSWEPAVVGWYVVGVFMGARGCGPDVHGSLAEGMGLIYCWCSWEPEVASLSTDLCVCVSRGVLFGCELFQDKVHLQLICDWIWEKGALGVRMKNFRFCYHGFWRRQWEERYGV